MYRETGLYTLQMPDIKSKSSYYTFTPWPLLDNAVTSMDAELAALLITAHRTLGVLDGMVKFAPNISIFESFLLNQEACYSNQIDEFKVSLYEALSGCYNSKINKAKIKNYVSATYFALERSISEKNICDAHSILLADIENQVVGRFREIQRFWGALIQLNTRVYQPTAPDEIKSTFSELLNYINAHDATDILIKIALTHYQFEIIHPFESGNGKMGRILVYQLLNQMGILNKPVLCLSEYLLLNKIEYFHNLSSAQAFGHYQQWVKFFIRALILSANFSIKRIEAFEDLLRKDMDKVMPMGSSMRTILPIFEYFIKNPVARASEVAKNLNISYNTAMKGIQSLIELNVVSSANNQTRYRSFAYKNILKLFDEEFSGLL